MESEERKNMEPSAGTRDYMVGKNVSAAQESSTAGHVVTEEPQTSVMSEEDALKNLTEKVRDQSELERDITVEANSVLMKAEDSKDENRIVKLEATKQRLQQQLDKEKKKMKRVYGNPYQSRNLRREIESLEKEIFQVTQDVCICQARIEKRHRESLLETTHVSKSKRLPDESNRQYLIRTGKITPFAQLASAQAVGIQGELANVIIDAEQEAAADLFQHETKGPTSHQSLRHPGFIDKNEAQDTDNLEPNIDSDSSMRPRKRRRTQKKRSPSGDSDYSDSLDSGLRNATFSQHENEDVSIRRPKHKTKAKVKVNEQEAIDLSKIDDGNEVHYQRRLRDWVTRRSRARQARRQSQDSNDMGTESDAMEDEWFKPSPDHADHFFGDSLKLPGDIHPALFEYQKTGVQWLAELYKQHVGGIIGDEMGLGKTVQLIAFIAALHYSKKLKRPVIVVAPATLLRQWVNEFHRWWPPLRVAIMHSSGSGMMHTIQEDEYDTESHRPVAKKSLSAAKRIVRGVVNRGHVLVTTYTGLQTYADELLPVEWEYAVLDEGHKIRNPNAEITVTCKELNTPNRVILSGTPVQNNLTELWSLFDFIYPMRLGTLVNFRTQFEIPIRHGGYANASNLQVMTAEKCAEALKETIGQYLLQRIKVDVAADLPEKTEQVLFCRLTDGQRQAYELFLKSDEVSTILNRRRQSLYGIDVLRKICNHPDLLDKSLSTKTGYEFGSPKLSAKLQLTKDLLQKIMIPNGHKILLFSQGKQMLDIIEKCIQKCGIAYLRMDGETPVDNRQPMIDKFNSDPDVHVFLLTTRTGGLGTNLTGADRIIIFDPDWNPSTDLQARERAWRLGQKKPVKIYRLMTEGTIEEKIYHRQIFKQFMTNKVLKDPKQRSSYDLSDLYDLFSYNPGHNAALERSEIFRGAEVDLAAVASDSTDGQKLQLADSATRPSTDAEERKLEHMKLVSAVEDYRQEASVHDEKRMLEGIFARSVNSAYDHEQIVNGRGKIQADINILREEANHVARQAAAHLRQSEEDARNIPIGTVTWTGEVGSGGRRVAPRRFGGPSSAGVMNNLATRQGLGRAATDGGSRAAMPGTGTNLTAKEFAPMIKTFINHHGDRVPSKMIVDHFDRYCAGKKQSNEFKTALDSVAVLHKAGSSGRGMWSLKPAS